MENILREAVLCFPITRPSVLLGRKTRHIGAGLLNGFGGGMRDLRWYPRARPPTGDMLPADRHWVPLVLLGRRIRASAWYGPGQERLVGKEFILHDQNRLVLPALRDA